MFFNMNGVSEHDLVDNLNPASTTSSQKEIDQLQEKKNRDFEKGLKSREPKPDDANRALQKYGAPKQLDAPSVADSRVLNPTKLADNIEIFREMGQTSREAPRTHKGESSGKNAELPVRSKESKAPSEWSGTTDVSEKTRSSKPKAPESVASSSRSNSTEQSSQYDYESSSGSDTVTAQRSSRNGSRKKSSHTGSTNARSPDRASQRSRKTATRMIEEAPEDDVARNGVTVDDKPIFIPRPRYISLDTLPHSQRELQDINRFQVPSNTVRAQLVAVQSAGLTVGQSLDPVPEQSQKAIKEEASQKKAERQQADDAERKFYDEKTGQYYDQKAYQKLLDDRSEKKIRNFIEESIETLRKEVREEIESLKANAAKQQLTTQLLEDFILKSMPPQEVEELASRLLQRLKLQAAASSVDPTVIYCGILAANPAANSSGDDEDGTSEADGGDV
ncbi:hypothetical protein BcDW1_2165 [Botrytis cinerea BcDW1]|uniref:Uncharacterized protein n=1 Tax=Botryotinia fuckeliana (strain BcDW1) TaxID=1290391 RepID=M7U695_BOTF1|nr:hypothetical protein BcDW1_2165 [Botrytis cinerea BcDW1]